MLTVKTTEKECELDESKYFGEIALPDEWLSNGVFSPFEMFLAMFKLDDISCPILPKSGCLYFFLDTKTKNYKPVVRYTNSELDASVEFNDGFEIDYDVETERAITVSECDFDETSSALMVKDKNCGEDIALFRFIPNENVNLFFDERKAFYFLISESDLKKLNFTNVKLKIVRF